MIYPKLLLGKKQEEALQSLIGVARQLSLVRNSIVDITPNAIDRFRYMHLELISIAFTIGGREAAERVFDAMNLKD